MITEKQLIEGWGGSIEPVVSICCITYNHENYIEQALDSFLMQETSFPFEIVIHDDASTDRTAEIIRHYQTEYPNIIKPIYQTENQKSKFKSGMNPRFNFPRALGKYIANCEGDDYWLDPFKLQKQVELLESNPRLVACHHWQKLAIKNGDGFEEIEAPKEGHGYYPYEADVQAIFENKLRVKTRTVMFKNIIGSSDITTNFPNVAFGDVPLSFVLGKYGRFGFIDEPMAVYRQTDTGVSKAGLKELGVRKFKVQHYKNWIQIWDYADKFYDYKYHKEVSKTIIEFYKHVTGNLPVTIKSFADILYYDLFQRKLPITRKLTSTRWIISYYKNKFGIKMKKKLVR